LAHKKERLALVFTRFQVLFNLKTSCTQREPLIF